MAIMRTDDAHYAAIADALRQHTGTEDTFQPARMAQAVGAVYAAAGAACAAKHFTAAVPGSGEQRLQFSLPFAPDYLAVLCSDGGDLYGNGGNLVYSVYFDFAAFGLLGGVSQVTDSSGLHNIAMTTESIHNRYSRADDGTVTIENVGEGTIGVFGEGRDYLICAVKYDRASDKDRITGYVRSLTGSGSATMNRAKVEAAFTEEEWAALTAEKPGWTFSFI